MAPAEPAPTCSASVGETTVRRAVPADAEAIARVHTTTWQAAYRDVLPAAQPLRAPVGATDLLELRYVTRLA